MMPLEPILTRADLMILVLALLVTLHVAGAVLVVLERIHGRPRPTRRPERGGRR